MYDRTCMLSLYALVQLFVADVTDSRSSSFGITTSEELKQMHVFLVYMY